MPQNQGAMLQADDLAKIFGSQDNFNMLKGLLNQTSNNKKDDMAQIPHNGRYNGDQKLSNGKPPPAFVKNRDIKKPANLPTGNMGNPSAQHIRMTQPRFS